MIKFFKADATILFSYIFITRAARPEDCYTRPMDVRPVTSARYIVAVRLGMVHMQGDL
jgi:hypothetical protein